jgi:hypothetical protein
MGMPGKTLIDPQPPIRRRDEIFCWREDWGWGMEVFYSVVMPLESPA